jgi:hypothetical protein
MKFQFRLIPLTVLLVALALAIGCSDDSNVPTNPDTENTSATEEDYDIIAEDLAFAITNPDDGMLTLWQPMPPMEDPGDPAVDHFRDFSNLHDTTFTHRDFTTTIDVTFFDAADNPSEVYDPEASVRLLRELTTSGEHSDDHHQMVVDLQSTLNMDNILETDEVRVINETGTRSEIGEMQGRHEDHFRTWDAYHEWESTDVNINVDHDTYPYPLSGQVYHYTEMEKTMTDGHMTRTMTLIVGSTITFDGTNMALVEMDDGTQYYINLDDGRCHRHHRP